MTQETKAVAFMVKMQEYDMRITNAFENNFVEGNPSIAEGKAINEFIRILLEEGIVVQYKTNVSDMTWIKMKFDYGALGTLRVANQGHIGRDTHRYQVYKGYPSYTEEQNLPFTSMPLQKTRGGRYCVGINNMVDIIEVILQYRESQRDKLGADGYKLFVKNNKDMLNNLKGKRKRAWKGSKTLIAK